MTDKSNTQAAPYGYCPECGEPGVTRERRPDGDDKCVNGHHYPSRNAHNSQPTPEPVAQAEPVLPRDAVVGNATFRKGVPIRLVVEAAFRQAEYKAEQRPLSKAELQEQERNRRAIWDMIHGAPEACGSQTAESDRQADLSRTDEPQGGAMARQDDDACRAEPSEWVPPEGSNGDGSVAAMALQGRDERTPADFAIEHAGYLANSAERLLERLNEEDAAHLALNELCSDDDEFPAADRAHTEAIELRTDAARAVRECVYEFKKRADRAKAARASLPAGGVVEPVGTIVAGARFDAAITPAPRVEWSGCMPPVGTKLYTTPQPSETPAPIPMVLHCPKCGMQHIDAPEPSINAFDAALYGGDFPNRWTNPPHKSHLCHGCGTIWRPADVPTTGVKAIDTKGKADTWHPSETQGRRQMTEDEIDLGAFKAKLSDPTKAMAFLQRAGILGADGQLTERFGGIPASSQDGGEKA